MKPFQCTDCSKRFKTDNGRADHQKAAHGEPVMASRSVKPYPCTVCWKRFTTDKGRGDHMKNPSKKHEKMIGNIHPSIIKLLHTLSIRTQVLI